MSKKCNFPVYKGGSSSYNPLHQIQRVGFTAPADLLNPKGWLYASGGLIKSKGLALCLRRTYILKQQIVVVLK